MLAAPTEHNATSCNLTVHHRLIPALLCYFAAGGAPITKGLLLAGVSTSVILQASISGRRRVPLLVNAFTHVFAFRQSPTELIFGTALLYYCRLFERLQVRGRLAQAADWPSLQWQQK